LAKVAEVLTYIEDRLAELDEEKTELEAYRKLENERRAIEHAYYDRQYRDTTKRLEECEEERAEELARATKVHDDASKQREEQTKLDAEIAALTAERDRAVAARARLDAERTELRTTHAQLTLDVADAERALAAHKQSLHENAAELKKVQKAIGDTQNKIARAKPAFEKHDAKESELRASLDAAERRLNALYSKQGRAAQFKTKAARDAWLTNELNTIASSTTAHETQIAALDAELKKLNDRLKENEQLAAKVNLVVCVIVVILLVSLSSLDAQREKSIVERRTALDRAANELNEVCVVNCFIIIIIFADTRTQIIQLRARRDKLASERKELWRDDSLTTAAWNDCRTELAAAERQLQVMFIPHRHRCCCCCCCCCVTIHY
jgi:structural maintenance of chromosome 3 (chondroitin sulfate proteoglycan 6)